MLNINQCWARITDLLRATYICKDSDQIIKTLNLIDKNDRVTILRLKPRFGSGKKLNDMIINFEYQGKMICELQIKLICDKVPFLLYSNHMVYEIERACKAQNRYKLFEAYSKS